MLSVISETRVLIEKITDLYQEFMNKASMGKALESAVRFIKEVKQIAPPKVEKPTVRIASLQIFALKITLA